MMMNIQILGKQSHVAHIKKIVKWSLFYKKEECLLFTEKNNISPTPSLYCVKNIPNSNNAL